MPQIYNSCPRFHSGERTLCLGLFSAVFVLLAAPLSLSAQTGRAGDTQLRIGQHSTVDQEEGEELQGLRLSGRFHLKEGQREGLLIVKAKIVDGSYIYSLTQKGDIPPTKLSVKPTPEIKIKGPFKADRTAEVIPHDPVFKIRVEKHKNLVQFYAPIELPAGVDPTKVKAQIEFNGQVCSDEGFCMPVRGRKIVAGFAGYFQKQADREDKLRRR